MKRVWCDALLNENLKINNDTKREKNLCCTEQPAARQIEREDGGLVMAGGVAGFYKVGTVVYKGEGTTFGKLRHPENGGNQSVGNGDELLVREGSQCHLQK